MRASAAGIILRPAALPSHARVQEFLLHSSGPAAYEATNHFFRRMLLEGQASELRRRTA